MLEEKQEDGRTYRSHLESLSSRRRTPHPDLIGPELPESGRHIWEWFLELASASPEAIAYQEIEAWSRLTGRRPTTEDVSLIMLMDRKRRG